MPRKTAAKRPAKRAAKRPAKATPAAAKRSAPRPAKPAAKSAPRLLAGGNPQIAKGYGDGPVQAYIQAIPGWKRGVTARLDELVTKAVPGARKAVKWNSPLYGADAEGAGWFLGIHMYTNYVKVAFFRGAALSPKPPGESKQKTVRYLDIREGDTLDEAQLTAWVRQAARIPGEVM